MSQEEQENQNNNNEEERQREFETKIYDAKMRDKYKITISSELALKILRSKADKLKKEIGEFSVTLFTLALLFAGSKDLFDICSVQLASWLDWTIDLSFGVVLFVGLAKGNIQQIKRIRLTVGSTSIFEMIPIIGALSLWTASLLWLYIKTSQENSAKTMELEKLQKKIAKLESEIAQTQ